MDNMTAKMSAFARAYHYKNNETHVFADSKAEMILGEDYEKIAASLTQGIPFFLPNYQGTKEEGLRKIMDSQISPSVLARSAYCEKMLQNERQLGCGQYIVFASGYDTYSVRNKENNLHVFELDLPVMIEDKKARIAKAGLVSDTVFVPCDLSKSDWVEELVRKGFKTTIKSFGSLLGITYYLEKKDLEILLRRIGSLMVKGSAICFDYQTTEESSVTKKNEALAASAGEQMKAAYSLDELELILQNCGFLIYEHLNHEEITGQYFEDYNAKNPGYIMQAPEGVGYILAVREK